MSPTWQTISTAHGTRNKMDNKHCNFHVLLLLLLFLLILPLFANADGTDIFYEGTAYPQDAEYIDLGNFVVTDFDAFTAFLDQKPDDR